MIVEVKTEHFRNSHGYLSNNKCPLALALKEKFPDTHINVGGHSVIMDRNTYKISENWYDAVQINWWIALAQQGEKIESVKVKLILI